MYREWAPDPALADRLVCVWTRVAASGGTGLVVPDGCVDLVWGPRGPHVAGPDTGPMPVAMSPGDRYTGVRFRPGAVGEALGVPVEALRDLRVPLTDLGGLPGLDAEAVSAAIAAAGTTGDGGVRDVLGTVQEALAVRLRATPGPDPAAPAVAEALRAGRSVGEVARELGLSERQLHRRCVRAFGYGPKTLQRVVRFQRAVRLARRGAGLAEVALASGYADQSHMSNEVRRLAGVPLSQLVSRP
ncbi:helix-turn-helix transcriptional regulator [Planomonospora parontospora]|uniref:helix-turn-helix transcriptional regulator n=1 Tax=Planomonospora parontospora TaxID=58119 RepID=UPI00166FA70D|nr:helix-turn-helix transcriptional regulator [Planomonospora parontospora]GGL32457.1 AraC family transcriptional regulator [Planomonospora parontospora subsp. antibiotica]GII16936.1 AraC family transcriptional regulator [Planomonospora parontospora subsp. antibiotica]